MGLLKEVISEISELNKSEHKSLELKLVKFNEEFGELSAEILKWYGYKSGGFSRSHLKEEMADTLQVLLSIYSEIDSEVGISLTEVLEEIKIKNKKWRKQNEKTNNSKIQGN